MSEVFLHCYKVYCAVLNSTLLGSTLLYSTLLFPTIMCCPIKRLPNVFVIYSGMRLALPDNIDGIPVRHIQAYDCSENANIVRLRTDTDLNVFILLYYDTHNFSFQAGTISFILRVPNSTY